MDLYLAAASLLGASLGFFFALRRLLRSENLNDSFEEGLVAPLPVGDEREFAKEVQHRSHEFALSRARRAFRNAQLAAGLSALLIFIALAANAVVTGFWHVGGFPPSVVAITGAVPGAISASFLLESRLAQSDLMAYVLSQRARDREEFLISQSFHALESIPEGDVRSSAATQLAVLYASAAATSSAPLRRLGWSARRASRRDESRTETLFAASPPGEPRARVESPIDLTTANHQSP